MAIDEKGVQEQNWLLERAWVEERPFMSETAVVGGLIVRFRQLWNSVAAKWYIRPLLRQQNEFNQLIAQSIYEQNEWLIAQDHEQTANNHNIAELTVQLIQTNRLLHSIDERLSRLESHQ
jgi:hypothetical protein